MALAGGWGGGRRLPCLHLLLRRLVSTLVHEPEASGAPPFSNSMFGQTFQQTFSYLRRCWESLPSPHPPPHLCCFAVGYPLKRETIRNNEGQINIFFTSAFLCIHQGWRSSYTCELCREKRISGITPTVNYQKSWSALSEAACRRGRDVGGNKEMDFAFNESQTGG